MLIVTVNYLHLFAVLNNLPATISVREDTAVNTVVFEVNATSGGGSLSFSIDSHTDVFSVDSGGEWAQQKVYNKLFWSSLLEYTTSTSKKA